MITKEKILEILDKYANDNFGINSNYIDHIEFDDLADEIVKNCSIPDVSARLSSSLGECVEGNDYEIVADKDGRFWINHKEVGSGEPLEQWIDSVLNVR